MYLPQEGASLPQKAKLGCFFFATSFLQCIFLWGTLSEIIRNMYLCVWGTVKYSTLKYTDKHREGLTTDNLSSLVKQQNVYI